MFKHTKAHMPLTPVSFNIMFVQNIFVYGNIKRYISFNQIKFFSSTIVP